MGALPSQCLANVPAWISSFLGRFAVSDEAKCPADHVAYCAMQVLCVGRGGVRAIGRASRRAIGCDSRRAIGCGGSRAIGYGESRAIGCDEGRAEEVPR